MISSGWNNPGREDSTCKGPEFREKPITNQAADTGKAGCAPGGVRLSGASPHGAQHVLQSSCVLPGVGLGFSPLLGSLSHLNHHAENTQFSFLNDLGMPTSRPPSVCGNQTFGIC